MQDYSKVKVGDTVWWTDVNRGGLKEGVVTKVGHKLIKTDWLTFNKETGSTNDQYRHQTLITDKELYLAEEAARQAMFALYKGMRYGSPNAGVTAEDIKAAAKLLKINL